MQNLRLINKNRVFALIFCLLLIAGAALAAAAAAVLPPMALAAAEGDIPGAAAYLTDADGSVVMYAKNETAKRPIASMVKIMTALLVFEAMDRGELAPSDLVPVSENAAGMGGSQVFLDAGTQHTAEQLIKAVIVCSANDACVALAEKISGSVPAFVDDMNRRAAELGMTDTHFSNCTGLPAPGAFSTAKDVSVMFRELIRHPAYFDYSGIWTEDYAHPGGRTTNMTNTNKLVRFYDGCDGGKTGFTSEAKFCLAATAERKDMRVIAVVLGGESSKQRFGAVTAMFDRAFGGYESKLLAAAGENFGEPVPVRLGKKRGVAVAPERDIRVIAPRGGEDGAELRTELPEKVKAPVKAGDVLGKVTVIRQGKAISEVPLVAAESVEKAGIFDLLRPRPRA